MRISVQTDSGRQQRANRNLKHISTKWGNIKKSAKRIILCVIKAFCEDSF